MRAVFVFLLLAVRLFAETLYVTQTGAGSADGSSLGNAWSMASLNTSGNWGAGAGKVSGGDTVSLNGTLTTAFTAQGSGTAGNVITILFASGAKFSAAHWGASTSAAMTVSGKNYLTIDGGSNGIVECTANGSALANQVDTLGLRFATTDNCIVQNLTIQNIYVRVANHATDLTGKGVAIQLDTVNTNFTCQSCTISMCLTPFSVVYSTTGTTSNIIFQDNTCSHFNWGVGGGNSNNGANLSGWIIRRNTFNNYTEWDDAGDNFHHNGVFVYTSDTGSNVTGLEISSNTFGPHLNNDGHATACIFYEAIVTAPIAYNNLFLVDANSTVPAQAFIFDKPQPTFTRASLFYNNSIISKSQTGTGINAGENGAIIKNNYFYSLGSAIYQDSNTPSGLGQTIDYNNYSSNNASNYGDLGRSFASWQGLTGNPDSHGNNTTASVDGNYIPNAGDTALLNLGVSLSGSFTTDKLGTTRPQGAGWDIGAFEYAAGAGGSGIVNVTTLLNGGTVRVGN